MAFVAIAGMVALALSACGSGTSGGGAPAGRRSAGGTTTTSTTVPKSSIVHGGTVTVGQVSGTQPNWIWPFVPVSHESVPNGQDFIQLMYRPLYMFGDNSNSVKVNYPRSLANVPHYSRAGRTVTIHMKGWKWSNGETVDAQDVAFWLNMMKAEKNNDGGYSPGLLPDNLQSYSIPSPETIVLHLTKGYASTWFTYNQLAVITPMPLAWDVTSAGAKSGSGGCHVSASHCAAVYKFLNAQAEKTSTYAKSPIWGVVDGPWKLSVFSNDGNDTFVPNQHYSGSPKPKIAALKYVTYTSDTTQYTALRSGSLDVGGIPSQDLPQKPPSQSLPATNPLGSGYRLYPFYTYAIAYYILNFKNPTLGPVLNQLYFRQALMYVNDQIGMAKAVYRGYAYPTTGPVPSQPPNDFLPPIQKANGGQGPYPYDPSKAKHLLENHGWKMVKGVMTCETPSRCGTGIKAGTKASFTMNYTSGYATQQQQNQVYKSDASKVGINIQLVGQSFDTLLGEASPKNPHWSMIDISGWAYDGPGFLPTGEPLFLTGAASNSGSYSSRTMDRLIRAVQTNSRLSLFHQYATYAAKQLPFIWFPQTYGVQAVKSNLHGVGFNPMYTFLPEYWYLTK